MNFQQELGSLKSAIDAELEYQLDLAIKETRKKDIFAADTLTYAKKIVLSGGKRLRGALLCQAYFGAGGKEKKKILKAAAAIELAHLFLLIHDDVIDKGDLRHGQKTLHKMLAEKKSKHIPADIAAHYGYSVAIIAGDMLYALAVKIIAESGFKSDIVAKVLSELQSIVTTTIIGESQDVEIAHKKNKVTEKEVIAMYANKTARYTVEGPLLLGMKFAGSKNIKTAAAISRYALPLGIAFQIQDDILGIFGDENKIGKSVASDTEEGKQSLLAVKARELATPAQKKMFDSILGQKNLSAAKIKIFKNILETTGAYDYAKDAAQKYLRSGKREIKKIKLLPNAKAFLLHLAEYLEGRDV